MRAPRPSDSDPFQMETDDPEDLPSGCGWLFLGFILLMIAAAIIVALAGWIALAVVLTIATAVAVFGVLFFA